MSTTSIRRSVVAVIATLIVAGMTLLIPFSSSASAAGLEVTYSLTNNTGEDLTLKSARVGNGPKCLANPDQVGVSCPATNPQDFPGSVSRTVVQTGQTTVITLQIQPRNPPETFEVYYTIGAHGAVHLSEDRNGYGCKVIGTKAYTCRFTNGLEREWVLNPA